MLIFWFISKIKTEKASEEMNWTNTVENLKKLYNDFVSAVFVSSFNFIAAKKVIIRTKTVIHNKTRYFFLIYSTIISAYFAKRKPAKKIPIVL